MSVPVRLEHPADVAGWRLAARKLLRDGVAPHDVLWHAQARQDDLFMGSDQAGHHVEARSASVLASSQGMGQGWRQGQQHQRQWHGHGHGHGQGQGQGQGQDDPIPAERVVSSAVPREAALTVAGSSRTSVSVPASFLALAERVACHRAEDRFSILYRVLWRHAQGESGLLDNPLDDDIHRLGELSRAVARDRHKMHAFVRFRQVSGIDEERFVAWFEPDHFIVRLASGFFKRRFSNMCWSILTPDESVHWDGRELVFAAGSERSHAPGHEPVEELWKTYFANIFNPARLRTDAMCAEMPVKYWKNLPEAPLIAGLIHDSGKRHAGMLKAPPLSPPRFAARAVAPEAMSLPDEQGVAASSLTELRQRSAACSRCSHACRATRTVHGEGPDTASLMLVGEQAGDQEDLQGRPFVGPAGQLLRTLLAEIDMPASRCYLSNAVRHFDYVPRGKHRLHKTPSADVIERCRPWLFEEIRLVSPRIIVGLGASAARSLTGRVTRISEARGVVRPFGNEQSLLLTAHPAAVLRERDPKARALARARLKEDLVKARAEAALAEARAGVERSRRMA